MKHVDYPTSKEQANKLLEGSISILKDNKQKLDAINKIIYVIESIKTAPINENDVVKIMSTCKDYLQRSHDLANENMPKINGKARGIVLLCFANHLLLRVSPFAFVVFLVVCMHLWLGNMKTD